MSEKRRDSDAPEEPKGGGETPAAPEQAPEDKDAPEQDELESEASSELDEDSEEGETAASESEHDDEEDFWEDEVDPLATADDAIDPELLAIADEKPPFKWYRPLIMTAVCVLIVIMMVWFYRDVAYFFTPPDPIDLGEAHDITWDEAWENRYVEIDGIPLMPRNENPAPQCGAGQGFPTYQRRFLCRGHMSAIPVMGRPGHDLIVQRYMVRQLRVHYTPPDDRPEERTLEQVAEATRRVAAVHELRPAAEGELGRLIVGVEGSSGRTNLSAVANSIKFQIEASVPRITRVRVERVRREVPGAFQGRLVRLSSLGSRFEAVADFLNECTNYPLSQDAWVLLDGSEAGEDTFDNMGLCYGHQPRQYWPYLALYVLLGVILVLNIILMVRFFLGLRRDG